MRTSSNYYTYTPQQRDEPPGTARPPRRRRIWRRLLAVLLLAVLIAGLSVAWMGWKLFANTPKVFGGSAVGNMLTIWQPTTLKNDGSGVVTVLVVGNSVDDPGHPASDLTDSIMLMRVNTATHKVALLSIPRDLLVDLPDYGYRKINEAYHWGTVDHFAASDYPSGGIGLLEQMVSTHFGVPIHYYALVNYGAVKNVVDAVGGVDVTIQSSDPRGLYDPNIQVSEGGPLLLTNGQHHLNGQTALNLARARGNPTPDGRVGYGFPRSDLDRSDHQRLLLAALQKKLLSTEVLTNPVTVGRVFDGLGSNIHTDMRINEARRLAEVLRSKDATMQSASLVTQDNNLLRSYTTKQGQSALIPAAGLDNFTAIKSFTKSLAN